MKLENQVCSLEQAKRLMELGIEQFNSQCSYCTIMPDPTGETYYTGVLYRDSPQETLEEHIADAFTVSELQIMCGSVGNIHVSDKGDAKGKFYSDINPTSEEHKQRFEYYNTLADAFAAKLIRAIDSGWKTAEECNKRLMS